MSLDKDKTSKKTEEASLLYKIQEDGQKILNLIQEKNKKIEILEKQLKTYKENGIYVNLDKINMPNEDLGIYVKQQFLKNN